jgi:transposase InsO family protein
MIEAVKEVAQSSDKNYGSRRMKHALNALGYPVGRRKARSLMREAGVKARYRRKFKVTTKGFWGLSVLKRHNPLQPLSTVASRGVLTFS